MRTLIAGCVLAVALGLGATPAAAQKRVTIGLYAPTAPFIGPSQRLEYVTRLAEHLSKAAPGYRVVGRVFASGGAFVSAVNRGDVQFAVLDAPYAAARGLPYKVLAAVSRNGASSGAWMLVAKSGVRSLADLKGQSIALPRVGARARAFLANVLFEGEIPVSYFGKLTRAPDAHSAVTLVGLGRVRAAVVPSGVSLSRGVRRLVSLRKVGWPMFIALRNADTALATRFRSRVRGFSGGSVFSGFVSASAADYRGLRSSFARRKRRGPMAIVKPSRLAVSGLVRGRKFEIRVVDIAGLVTDK